jgi:hypothetical protein
VAGMEEIDEEGDADAIEDELTNAMEEEGVSLCFCANRLKYACSSQSKRLNACAAVLIATYPQRIHSCTSARTCNTRART